MSKPCNCDWHKEYKFLCSLESKLDEETYQKLCKLFEEKWMVEEDLQVANLKLSGKWLGYDKIIRISKA